MTSEPYYRTVGRFPSLIQCHIYAPDGRLLQTQADVLAELNSLQQRVTELTGPLAYEAHYWHWDTPRPQRQDS